MGCFHQISGLPPDTPPAPPGNGLKHEEPPSNGSIPTSNAVPNHGSSSIMKEVEKADEAGSDQGYSTLSNGGKPLQKENSYDYATINVTQISAADAGTIDLSFTETASET